MASPPRGGSGIGAWAEWLNPRRLWEVVFRIARLDDSIVSLKEENASLRRDIIDMQKQLADHNGQLRLLTTFVRDSLTNRLESKIEKLAAELLADREQRK